MEYRDACKYGTKAYEMNQGERGARTEEIVFMCVCFGGGEIEI